MVATSVVITKDNLFTQLHANIFNLLNNRTNVPDPARPNDTGTTRTRKFVYVREPNWSASNFAGFPALVVSDPKHSQNNKTADSSKAFQTDEFLLTIYAQDKTSDSDGDASAGQQIRDITTDIVNTINDNYFTLRNNGLRNSIFDTIDFPEWGEVDGKPVAKREITLRFSNQLRRIR